MYGNEKGIAAKVVDGVICVDIHETFIQHLASIPKSYKNWRRFKLIPKASGGSFYVEPLDPSNPKNRETKITGPAEFK